MGLILIIYILISIVFTYPLINNLGTLLPGQPNDAYVYLWNIGNFWHEVFLENNPFQTIMVMYPVGVNLFFHTYAPLVSLIALPFLKNLPVFMGLAIIFAVGFSSFTSFVLIKKITKNNPASFVGGLIYGLSPIIHSFITSQHYYFLFSSIFYPLGLLFLINFFETKKYRYLILVLSTFWLVLFIDYYSAVLYVLLISIFYVIEIFFIKGNLKRFFNKNDLIKYILLFILYILIPILVILLNQWGFNEFINFKQIHNTSNSCNTNLLGFLIPNTSNPILGNLSSTLLNLFKMEINLDTPSYFLGWGLLTLTLASFYKYRSVRFVKNIIIIFFTFLFLSLGTTIKIGDTRLLEDVFTPFYYFLKIPLLSSIDCPIRFPIIMQLCISIILSIFISNHKKIPRIALIVLLLIVVEYGIINKDFSSTKIPEIYKILSDEPGNFTLLEVPSGITESKGAFGYDWSIQALHSQQMYWQTLHDKPRVGAYVSRITSKTYNFFKNEPVISDIFTFSSLNGNKPTQDITDDQILKFINKFNLGHIILSPNPRQIEFSDFIENEFKNYIISKQTVDGFIYYKLK